MQRLVGKHTPRKFVIALSCVVLCSLGLFVDNLWKSSWQMSPHSASSLWSSGIEMGIGLSLHDAKKHKANVKIDKLLAPNFLNKTFADLPAPHLEWEEMPSAPVPRLDGASVQIKNLLYVFAGYGTIDFVHSHVDIYNFTDNTWCGRFDMPKEMANSHLGMATDGRYVYAISGQYGPQCRSPIAHCFVLDTKTKKWHDFPQLPFPRYKSYSSLLCTGHQNKKVA
ncbi:hypothetical protein HPP92_002348 [Vanilla planifolia]|uniref:Kelch repeat-containing protein n=1 Tax=Vanilla planifolia TaxID=51239 RepID=A0A835S9K6_VANPL|nr:hypothetical protein HPP92_002348 [Vanilla planifolia]